MIIQTASLELAVYTAGDPSADRVALLLPGRLDTKDYPHMRAHVAFLARHGFYALSFDPPGTWESPGNITLYTMSNYLLAINELIALLGNKPTVLMGHSRGGSMAMLAGLANEAVTHIISVCSEFGPLRHIGDETIQNGKYLYERDLPFDMNGNEKKRFALPHDFYEDQTSWTGLDTCTKPKLLFYGTRDDVVPEARVRNTYERAGEPKQLVAFDSDHEYFRHPRLITEVNERVGKFLKVS